MDKDYLTLKRASASRLSSEWSEDDYDVLADGVVVGRIMKAAAVPVGQSWMWTLAFGHHEDRTPTHGYSATGFTRIVELLRQWQWQQRWQNESRKNPLREPKPALNRRTRLSR